MTKETLKDWTNVLIPVLFLQWLSALSELTEMLGLTYGPVIELELIEKPFKSTLLNGQLAGSP